MHNNDRGSYVLVQIGSALHLARGTNCYECLRNDRNQPYHEMLSTDQQQSF